MSGEISKNPPPTASTGGPQPKTGAATGTPPAPKTEPVTTASKGIPVEAIHTSAKGSAKGGATEFGAQVVLAAQLESVRGAEAAKAAAALENLAPEIEKLRLAGNGVVVTLVMEVPNQVDIAAIWAGIGVPGQVVYFKKMYISQVISAMQSSAASTQSTIRANLAPGDPEQQDPHELTLQQQIKGEMGGRNIRYPGLDLGKASTSHPANSFFRLSRRAKNPAVVLAKNRASYGTLPALIFPNLRHCISGMCRLFQAWPCGGSK